MILTITLNPAIDRTYIIPDFRVNHTHRSNQMSMAAGGKGINVSRMLRELGAETLASGLIGGANGDYIRSALVGEGIPSDFMVVSGETRMNIKVSDPKSDTHTEINEPGPQVTPDEVHALLGRLEMLIQHSEFAVMSGSLPPGVPTDIYKQLIEIADRHGVPTLLDASGESLRLGIEACPFLVKPNAAELSGLFNLDDLDINQAATAANKLGSLGVKWVVVSLGDAGSVLCHGGHCWHVTSPQVPVASVAGSGDALIAAWAYAFSRGLSMEDAARLGSAAGAANAMHVDAGTCRLEEIQSLVEQVHIVAMD